MKNDLKFLQIINDLSTSISTKSGLSQERIFFFMEKLAENSGLAFETPKTAAFGAMKNLLNEMWQYREWEDLSAEQAFLYGQLYGCIKLCEYREENRQNAEWMDSLVSRYAGMLWLFHAAKENPGIRHKELAAKGQISPARLSQIMDLEEMDNLFSCRLLGREKYYFLSFQGEAFLLKLEKENAKKAFNAANSKAMKIDNTNTSVQWAFSGLACVPHEFGSLIATPHLENAVYLNNLDNCLTAIKRVIGGEKECLTENSYHGQRANHLRAGLQMCSVG